MSDDARIDPVFHFLLSNPRLVHVIPAHPAGSLVGRRLVHVHLPRTAGTTLDRIIGTIALRLGIGRYRARGTVYGQFFGDDKHDAAATFRKLSPSDTASAAILTGHIPVQQWGPAVEAWRPAYVSVLRDPVDRMMSQYRLGVARGGWRFGTAVDELVRSGRLVDNLQVRMLAGCGDASERCDNAMLEKALAMLRDRFALVGFTERFDRFLAALLGLYGWPHVVYARYNVSSRPRETADEDALRREAAAHSALDAELIARARQHGDVWINRVDGADAPPTAKEALMPLKTEGEFLCFERDRFDELEKLAARANCRIARA